MTQSSPYIGIDGCPRGWVAVGLGEEGFSTAVIGIVMSFYYVVS